jgi:hypothetical protein
MAQQHLRGNCSPCQLSQRQGALSLLPILGTISRVSPGSCMASTRLLPTWSEAIPHICQYGMVTCLRGDAIGIRLRVAGCHYWGGWRCHASWPDIEEPTVMDLEAVKCFGCASAPSVCNNFSHVAAVWRLAVINCDSDLSDSQSVGGKAT